MPELPDVEVIKRYLGYTALHKTVKAVKVNDDQVLMDITAQDLKSKLPENQFTNARRHGKYLFVELDQIQVDLLLHFGMTGRLKYYHDSDSLPEYEQIRISFQNDYHLAYVSVRKLGKVGFVPDPDDFIANRGLGADVFREDFTLERFRGLIEDRRGMIKSALMDQHLMAGIGNVYSDEILFQAGIHPRTDVKNLAESDLEEIYRQIKSVLGTAIEEQADPENYPTSYLTPLRGKEDAECPGCSGVIERIDVSGRGAYFCPNCQSKVK